MVLGDHVWKELLSEIVVRKGVDLEGKVDVLFGAIEDRLAACDSCVVDEDGGVTDGGANL